MTDHMSPNSRESIGVIDSITNDFFYVEGSSSNGGVNVNLAGSAATVDTIELTGMLPIEFDYISASYPDADTEIYTYRTGGSGGTVVATITANYTDSTKEFITNVTRV